MNKLKFKIEKSLLLVLTNALNNPIVLQEIGSKNVLTAKLQASIIYEVIDIFNKKFFSTSKTANIELYKHSADALFLMLVVILEVCQLSILERTQITQLKDKIHQEKIAL